MLSRASQSHLVSRVDSHACSAGFLDGRYEAFGRVYQGMDVVQKINAVRVGGNKKEPVDKVSIDADGEYTQ